VSSLFTRSIGEVGVGGKAFVGIVDDEGFLPKRGMVTATRGYGGHLGRARFSNSELKLRRLICSRL
jgi:hypothetical protein